MVIVSLIVKTIVGQIVSVVGMLSETIKKKAITNIFLRAFYSKGVVLDILCINFKFGYCAEVCMKSLCCINKFNHSGIIRRSNYKVKVVRSMPKIKITFGRTNFTDLCTPVVIQEYTSEKILETLLLRHQNCSQFAMLLLCCHAINYLIYVIY